jgi:hypothetical protein
MKKRLFLACTALTVCATQNGSRSGISIDPVRAASPTASSNGPEEFLGNARAFHSAPSEQGLIRCLQHVRLSGANSARSVINHKKSRLATPLFQRFEQLPPPYYHALRVW